MNAENPPQPELNPADVAACAYMIWEKEGKPHGRDAEHWLQAEAMLRVMHTSETEATRATTAAAQTAQPAAKSEPATRKRKVKRSTGQSREGATE